MCGTWEVTFDYRSDTTAYLRCGKCKGNITRLPHRGTPASIDSLIGVVLRHMCSSHGYNLSGAGNDEDKGRDAGEPDGGGVHRGDRRAGDLVR